MCLRYICMRNIYIFDFIFFIITLQPYNRRSYIRNKSSFGNLFMYLNLLGATTVYLFTCLFIYLFIIPR